MSSQRRTPLPALVGALVCGLAGGCILADAEVDAGPKPDAPPVDAPLPIDARLPADAAGSADAGPPDAGAPACNGCTPATGRCAPLTACSTADPCTVLGGGTVTTALDKPTCKTTAAGRTVYDDGPAISWRDLVTGNERAICRYMPPTASAEHPVPLVVFLHGSHGSADDVYNNTSLRAKAVTADLADDPQHLGFALISMQGLNLHWEGTNPAGRHHDYLFRDLAALSTNPDVRALDRAIDDAVRGGMVDPRRIYVVGWSNGAFMAQLYAVARFTAPTPAGRHISAAVAYAGGDPFGTWDATMTTCAVSPYPKSSVPMLLVHRSCDALVACDDAQRTKFGLAPKDAVEPWIDRAAGVTGLADVNIEDLILDANGVKVTSCAAASVCTVVNGGANHIRWPDGVADSSGKDSEPAMIEFLRAHPHP